MLIKMFIWIFHRSQKGIEIHDADLQGEPSTSFEFVYSVLLPMLVFFPAFVAGSLSIDSLTEEFENNTVQTLLSALLTVKGMVSAKISSVLILSFLQCGAWLVLLKLNGIAIQNIGWIFLLALIISGITSTSAALYSAQGQRAFSIHLCAYTASRSGNEQPFESFTHRNPVTSSDW